MQSIQLQNPPSGTPSQTIGSDEKNGLNPPFFQFALSSVSHLAKSPLPTQKTNNHGTLTLGRQQNQKPHTHSHTHDTCEAENKKEFFIDIKLFDYFNQIESLLPITAVVHPPNLMHIIYDQYTTKSANYFLQIVAFFAITNHRQRTQILPKTIESNMEDFALALRLIKAINKQKIEKSNASYATLNVYHQLCQKYGNTVFSFYDIEDIINYHQTYLKKIIKILIFQNKLTLVNKKGTISYFQLISK